jgi:hypothetical protein
MVVVGYLFFFRIFVTIVHYKFGLRLYRYIRRSFRRFNQYDLNVTQEFPLYSYSEYLKILQIVLPIETSQVKNGYEGAVQVNGSKPNN